MNWFQNLSSRTKLLLSFSLVCAILSGISAYALLNMRTINNTVRVTYNEQLLPISALGKVQLATTSILRVGDASAIPAEKEARRNELQTIEEARKEFATLLRWSCRSSCDCSRGKSTDSQNQGTLPSLVQDG